MSAGSRHPGPRAGRDLVVLAFLLAAFPPAALAQATDPPQARVTVRPPVVRLGERVEYRASVVVQPGAKVAWMPPDSVEALTWGERRTERAQGFIGGGYRRHSVDTASVVIAVQAFEFGRVEIPGLGVRVGEGPTARDYRLAGAAINVVPVMTAADSAATLRDLHGLLAAPWWERVPWVWVIAGLLLLALLVLWLKRRRRHETPAVAPSQPALDPAAAALAALSELRALKLPEQGKFAEHAFRLGQILRRYLEATVHTTRPGDTTPELVRHLADARRTPEDLARLAELLRGWDRIKFARAPQTLELALRSEAAVEALVRRPPAEPQAQVA